MRTEIIIKATTGTSRKCIVVLDNSGNIVAQPPGIWLSGGNKNSKGRYNRDDEHSTERNFENYSFDLGDTHKAKEIWVNANTMRNHSGKGWLKGNCLSQGHNLRNGSVDSYCKDYDIFIDTNLVPHHPLYDCIAAAKVYFNILKNKYEV